MRVRRYLGGTFIASALVLAVAFMFGLQAAPAAQGDLLPDLGMAKITGIRVETVDGRRLLRYSTEIANVGAGAFELNLHRSTTSGSFTTTQRIYTSTGWRDVATSPELFYAGDGHNHWHVVDLETVELNRSDNGVLAGEDTKVGFCFLDHVRYRSLPGQPNQSVYTGCGSQTSLDVRMGLSVGWSDVYAWNLPGQSIDITNLVPGRYRLNVVADKQQFFVESSESNNATWVDLQITGQGKPKIVGYGPSA